MSTSSRQGAYAVASVNVPYPLRPSLQVGAQVNHLLDATYYTRLGGTNGFNWFGEPRNAAVFLRWHR
jgi:outer membrane receptor for ferric coprogen and ferric-rhodotorulic acid